MVLFRVFVIGFCLSCLLIGLGFHPSSHHKYPDCANGPVIEDTPPSKPILASESKTNNNSPNNPKSSNKVPDYFACSSLRSQWVAANAAERTFWVTVTGLTLIVFTLFETLRAGKLISKQNDIAIDSARAEFQPYLKFSDRMTFNKVSITPRDGLDVVLSEDQIVNTCIAKEYSGKIWLEGEITIANTGKTPVMSGLHSVKLDTSEQKGGWIDVGDGNMKLDIEIFEEGQRGAIFSYIGSADPPQKVVVAHFITVDRDYHKKRRESGVSSSGAAEVTERDISKMRLRCQVRVSFHDPINDDRRVFYARYQGIFGQKDGIKLIEYMETSPEPEDDPTDWFKAFS